MHLYVHVYILLYYNVHYAVHCPHLKLVIRLANWVFLIL